MKRMFFSRMTIVMVVAAQFFASCSKDSEDSPTITQSKYGEILNQESAKYGYMILKRQNNTPLNRIFVHYTIGCKKEDEPNVWIDFNNNGKKDEKEAITSFTYHEDKNDVIYHLESPKSSEVIVVYGKVTQLLCGPLEISALEVSKNTNLVALGCDNNNLTELDVTKNTNLVTLNCSNNKITALDVTKNTNLVTLNCSNNKITALDVTKNTNLVTLNCDNNELTELDVTKNTNLEEIYCYHNSLTELGITKNANLRNLWCYTNKLDKTNMEKIIAALPNYTTGMKPRFCGWDENDNNYKSEELRNQIVGKGWEPYHSVGGVFKIWK